MALSHSLSLTIDHCAFPSVAMPESHCLSDGHYASQLHTMHLNHTLCLIAHHISITHCVNCIISVARRVSATARVSVAGSQSHTVAQFAVHCVSSKHICLSVTHLAAQLHTEHLNDTSSVSVAHPVSVMRCMTVVHHKSHTVYFSCTPCFQINTLSVTNSICHTLYLCEKVCHTPHLNVALSCTWSHSVLHYISQFQLHSVSGSHIVSWSYAASQLHILLNSHTSSHLHTVSQSHNMS